jgi:hypothetical protein
MVVAALLLEVACTSDEGKPGPAAPTGPAPVPDAGAAEAGAKKKVAEVGCVDDSECETNHCFVGGNQSFCTVPCTTANAQTICVPPLTGTCNMKGWCKRD